MYIIHPATGNRKKLFKLKILKFKTKSLKIFNLDDFPLMQSNIYVYAIFVFC